MKELWPQEALITNEAYDFPFAIYTIMCPLNVQEKASIVSLPNAIAIAYTSDWLSHMSPTFVRISYAKNMKQMFEKARPMLAVCLGPFQLGYTNAIRIVEFVEIYRILGAQHFYFYLLNATVQAKRVLDYYVEQNLATILHWNIDHQHVKDVYNSGVLAQINDCAYRAMVVDNFRYIAVVDFDEILVPYKHNSLAALLRQCDEGRVSAYIFRNVFYFKRDRNDTFSVPKHTINRFLYTQTKVRRSVEILPAYTGSKYIANPRSIIEAGVFNLWRTAPGFNDFIVHHTVGLLQHYKHK